MIKIDVWSDVVCPFCYLGITRLLRVMKQFPDQQFEIKLHAFLLQPDQQEVFEGSIYEFLSKKKGIAEAQLRQMNQGIEHAGKQEHIDFNFDKILVAPSQKAHQLIALAAENGKAMEVKLDLFKSYFTEGKNISGEDVKDEIINKFNMKSASDEKLKLLASEVRKSSDEAYQMGITGVPFFMFNNQFYFSGAQPENVFISAITKAIETPVLS